MAAEQPGADIAERAIGLLKQSDWQRAEEACRQWVQAASSDLRAWRGLGAALFGQRKWSEAADAFRRQAALAPNDPAAWSNLGAAEHNSSRLLAAHEAYERSLALAPGRAGTLSNLASLLVDRGQPRQGLALLEPVLSQQPTLAAGWVAAGNAWRLLENNEQAVAAHRRAWLLAPDQFEMRYNLAYSLLLAWDLDEAERLIRAALADQPKSAEAWWLLGTILQRAARHGEARQALEQSIELEPNAQRHSSLLVALHYADGEDARSLLRAHREWDERYCRSLAAAVAATGPAARPAERSGQPLRVGLVSSDLCLHPVGFLSLRGLECPDQSQCSLVCYSDLVAEDEFTVRFRAAAAQWRSTAGWSSEQLAEQIRDDGIDVLIDLMGHTGKRLLVFSRRPAPVQMTWLGYVGTTGMQAMDYLLADRFHVQPGEESAYAEGVLRLPHGYACYTAPDYAPAVGPPPALAGGGVTFGCFNNPTKYSASALDAWAAILERVPNSRLLLKFSGLDQPALQARLRGEFAARGIPTQRILLEGRAPHREFLAAYGRVDLALDAQPYSGGLTTCEALWMGVPVVTYPGRTFAGRHATSHLSNAGFPEFIAQSAAGYIDLAVAWAGRVNELAVIRSELRERMRQSPLCDAPRFAGDWLAVLRKAWEARARTSGSRYTH